MLQYIKGLLDRGLESASTLYVNLEDPRWGELSNPLLQAIWEAYIEWLEPKAKPFVFLDEIHLVPGWEKFVRSLHERQEANLFVSDSFRFGNGFPAFDPHLLFPGPVPSGPWRPTAQKPSGDQWPFV
jgi:predicted AAA+ superfamily ATPase